MKTRSFLGRLFPCHIPRLAAVALVALVWSGLAFCGEIHDATKNGDLAKVRDAVQAELKNTTSQIMGLATVCSYTAVNGSFTVTGRHVVAEFSFEKCGGGGVKGGKWIGDSKTDHPFAGSWKFTARSGLADLQVAAEVGSTFSFQGKSFKLTETGWTESQ